MITTSYIFNTIHISNFPDLKLVSRYYMNDSLGLVQEVPKNRTKEWKFNAVIDTKS